MSARMTLDRTDAAAPTVGIDIAVMARALAGLFTAGATLALLTVVLPHAEEANEGALLGIVANAYVVAAVLMWRAGSMPPRALRFALAWGSTLITAVAYFSAESPSPLVFFYLWIFLYSAYFFSRTETVLQIAYVGAAYAALTVANPPADGGAAWWVVGMGTMLVGALMIIVMRGKVASLIEHLYDAARTDPLTKLLNRRGFRELLDLELERARRAEGRLALLVGDLDHFKAVNDRAGHHVGDAVLQRVASVLSDGKRSIDAVARVGGEEFALLLPDTDQHGGYLVAERLRMHVQEAFAGASVPVTISFGIATYPERGETAGALLRAADEALYAAKASGRNRAVIHTPELRDEAAPGPGKRDIEGERYLAVVLDLAEAGDLRFSGSARHSETVGRYAEMMARQLRLRERHVGRVRLAGILHDVGKVAIPDEILRKPGALDDDEWAIIRRHPELGAQILEHPSLADLCSWVIAHHERPDGTGYPRGLAGDELPLEARILAVADAYEAMTSDRSYRSAIGHVRARDELRRGAGTQFDGAVVEVFLRALDREVERTLGVDAEPPAPARRGAT